MRDSRTIQDLLDRVRTRFRWLTTISVIAGLASMLLLALVLAVTLDQLFTLPRWFRILALLGGVSSGGWIAHRLLWGPLRGRVNDLFIARSIEGHYAGLKSGLTTYIQLSSDTEEGAALRELVGERVVQDLGPVRPEIVVPSREARRRGVALAGIVAIGLILFAVSPSSFWWSFRRTLLPIQNLTETQIAEVVPGNSITYKGKDLEIALRLRGKLPPAARLTVSRAAGDPLTYELPQRRDGSYRCVLPGVTEGFTYSFAANDATSDEYRIRVAEVPRLRSLAATLRFPSYTGFPVKAQDSGNLDAIEGTEVTLEGTATRPLRSAAMLIKGRKIASPSIRGDAFRITFPMTETLDYAVELVDKDGTADPEPSKFRVVVRKDAPPQVTITVPGKNVELAEPIPVRLAARVVDDFGLTALRLTAKVNGKDSRVLALPVPKERLSVAETTLDLKALGVGPGDYVEYFLTATDNKEPEPQSGQSAAYIVSIQSTLPLLTFADAHPDVRVEKYRDPWDRKGSVEPKSDRLRADDRSKENGGTQEPGRRDSIKRDVAKLEEKKPDAKKLDPAGDQAQKADPEAGREDALSKLLEEKKDLIERLLAKAGSKDAAGDAGRKGNAGAGGKTDDGRDGVGETPGAGEKPSAGSENPDRETPNGEGETARGGEGKKGGKAGKSGTARASKSGRGGGTEGAESEGAGEDGGEGPGSDGAGETAKGDGTARKPGGSGKSGKSTKPGRAGKAGRGGEGDGEGDDDSDGDDETADGDDDDGFDLADLFPFFGGT